MTRSAANSTLNVDISRVLQPNFMITLVGQLVKPEFFIVL